MAVNVEIVVIYPLTHKAEHGTNVKPMGTVEAKQQIGRKEI